MRKIICLRNLNIADRILSIVFRKYTYKIYRQGLKDGFNWKKK